MREDKLTKDLKYIVTEWDINDKSYDAVITDWRIVKFDDKYPVLLGTIFDDKKHRFADGYWFRSSVITGPMKKGEVEAKQGTIITTLNSRYLLDKEYKGATK